MHIAIIGCGNMGGSLAQRLSQSNQLFLYDSYKEKADLLAKQGYGKTFETVGEAIKEAEIIILAVKPQNLEEVADMIKGGIKANQTVVSLLAGTSIKTLKSYFPTGCILRMMPNLPLVYGEGVIGMSSEEKIEELKVFELLGKIYWLPEDKIDGLTALASSGPAFFFVMVESMIDAGIAMGFTAEEAQGLVYQMLKGSITLMEQTGKHPGVLKWQVASPKGTTIAGLKKLEESALRGSIINTFLAGYDRAQQF